MWKSRVKRTGTAELDEARALVAVLEDEVLRLKLATQRDSETARALETFRRLPYAVATTEEGDDSWQVLAEAMATQGLVVEVCDQMISAIEELRARLVDTPATMSAELDDLVLEAVPNGEAEFPKVASDQRKVAAEEGATDTTRRYGSEEQKQEWHSPMAAGGTIGCLGPTEPDAGSDPSARTGTRAGPTENGSTKPTAAAKQNGATKSASRWGRKLGRD